MSTQALPPHIQLLMVQQRREQVRMILENLTAECECRKNIHSAIRSNEPDLVNLFTEPVVDAVCNWLSVQARNMEIQMKAIRDEIKGLDQQEKDLQSPIVRAQPIPPTPRNPFSA